MRVLPQVESVAFDIPAETFTVELEPGAESAPVLAAITGLGYTPTLLDAAPVEKPAITHVQAPTSEALRLALARAKARDVLLLLDVGGGFCRLCRRFEATSLQDDRVLERLSAFEFLRIDVEEDPQAATDLDVHAVPDFWVLDGEGRVKARHNGYLDPDEFLELLAGPFAGP